MEQHTEPTQEEENEMHSQWLREREEEERWWIDEHNGEHQTDPPCCFDDSDDYHAHTASVSIDELPF